VIKAEEAAKLYETIRDRHNHEIDHEVLPQNWQHPAFSVRITDQPDEQDIQIFTDGSKHEQGVGAGIAIFTQDVLTHQLKYALNKSCSNNQAEQLAIVKALEQLEELHLHNVTTKAATIYTDSRITLQSPANPKNHNNLVEEIRKAAHALKERNWKITFAWIRAHAGNYSNKLADRLAKEAARQTDKAYNKLPKSAIEQQLRDQSNKKWQAQWDHSPKGQTTKEFFPCIKDRLNINIKLTPNFTAIATAHRKTKAYLHCFKILQSPECPCGSGNQTNDHLIYDCIILECERRKLIGSIKKEDKWPTNKKVLVNKYSEHFLQFVNSIDFGKL
jgi:ribonuclease HI